MGMARAPQIKTNKLVEFVQNNSNLIEEISSHEKIGRSTVIVMGAFGSVVYKANAAVIPGAYSKKSPLKALVHRINSGSISLINEQLLFSDFLSRGTSSALLPNVLEINAPNFIIIEHVKTAYAGTDLVDIPGLPKALAGFSQLPIRANRTLFQEIQFTVLQSPIRRTLMHLANNAPTYIGHQATFIAMYEVLKLSFTTRPAPQSLLFHNDFNRSNVLYNAHLPEEIYIIDLEHTYREKKWIFCDVIDASFDWRTAKLNWSRVLEYTSLIDFLKDSDIESRYANQVRFALIRFISRKLGSLRPSPTQKESLARLLSETLLSRRSFEMWLAKTISEK